MAPPKRANPKRPGTRALKNLRPIPPLNFKGVLISEQDFERDIFPHFRPAQPQDWKNNIEFKKLFHEYGLTREEVAGWLDKSEHTIVAYLKPRESSSSVNLKDEVYAQFLHELKRRFPRGPLKE